MCSISGSVSLPLAEDAANHRTARRTFLLTLFSGAALVLIAGFLGERLELGRCLPLDVNGVTAQGEATRGADGEYRIRYIHPSGAIYARGPEKTLGIQRIDGVTGSVWIRYSAEEPSRFQPYGVSLLPGVLALLLFLTGMALVLRSRRYLRTPRTAAGRPDTVRRTGSGGS